MRLAGMGMVGVVHATDVRDMLQRFSDRVDYGVLSQIINTIIYVKEGVITQIYDVGFTIKVPEGMATEMHVRPVTTVTDYETGALAFDVFRYDGETIIMPVMRPAERKTTPPLAVPRGIPAGPLIQTLPQIRTPGFEPFLKKEGDERAGWKLSEKEIQREIGRYTDGIVDVQMISDTKAVVFIDDKDVPAAIGKGGKNISAIVNKIGIGIDIKPRSDLDKTRKDEEEFNVGGGVKIQTDKKQLTIVAPDHNGKIVDVFSGKEYLFTATVNENGEIHLSKNSSIAQEMIRRSTAGEVIKLRPV
jgi:ATPase